MFRRLTINTLVPACTQAVLGNRWKSSGSSSSNKNDVSVQGFDLQDVDSDRLSHFYWDRTDHDDVLFFNDIIALEESEGMDGFDSFVFPSDLSLLEMEYL